MTCAPLRILKGFTEALDDECAESLNEEGKSFLKEIVRAADRMEGLIEALLALSRAGRAELHCETLDLSMLADMALYDLRHAKNARAVEVHVDAGLSGWGDVRLMMVVLRTLLNNAWKYTGRTANPVVRFIRRFETAARGCASVTMARGSTCHTRKACSSLSRDCIVRMNSWAMDWGSRRCAA